MWKKPFTGGGIGLGSESVEDGNVIPLAAWIVSTMALKTIRSKMMGSVHLGHRSPNAMHRERKRREEGRREAAKAEEGRLVSVLYR